MKVRMSSVQSSSLFPLKGRIGSYISLIKLATNTPWRGLGVNS